MSNDKDRDEIQPGPPGSEEEVKKPVDRLTESGEIMLREIPGLRELEARRTGKSKPSTSVFTLILLLLFGFTVVIFIMNKYRQEEILVSAAEEETGTAVMVSDSSGTGTSPAARSAAAANKPGPAAGPQTSQPRVAPQKYVLSEDGLSGKALLKTRAQGPLISDEKDPEIAAVGDALRSRVEALYGVRTRRARSGSAIIETTAGVFQGFRINSTRIKSGDRVTRDEIVVTTPSRGTFVIRNSILDGWRRCNYEQITRDLENSGIKVVKWADPDQGTVNVNLDVAALKGSRVALDLLISRQQVGRVALDMTIPQMKSAFPEDYEYVRKQIMHENEFYDVIKVFDGKKEPLFFVNEKDNRVWGIQVISDKYKTARGIGVGSTLGSLKIYYKNPKIWSAKGSAPLVSIDGIEGVFILENGSVDFARKIFPDSARINSILIGGSPYLK